MIINEATGIIEKELSTAEKLLWAGEPQRGFIWQKGDLVTVPFMIVWCGFFVVPLFQSWRMTESIISDAGWLPVLFLAFGLYGLFGRYIFDMINRSKTVYGVTSQRIIIMTNAQSKRLTSIDLSTLHEMTLKEQLDGRGSIIFSRAAPEINKEPVVHRSFRLSPPTRDNSDEAPEIYYPKFVKIEGAKSVYNLIREAQRNLRQPI